MAARIKKKDHEKLSDANIQKVIEGFAATPPMKKKDAYELLNINANPTRLARIIEEYQERIALDKRMRDANRGKPVQNHEVKYAIEQYLDGTPIGDIAKSLYRNSGFVKAIIQRVGVPTRGVGEDYTNYSPLPDECVSDAFNVGETAWASKYSGPCIIDKEMPLSVDGEARVYRIFVLETSFEMPEDNCVRHVGKPGFYAHQPAYELGKLDHLKQYGVDVTRRT